MEYPQTSPVPGVPFASFKPTLSEASSATTAAALPTADAPARPSANAEAKNPAPAAALAVTGKSKERDLAPDEDPSCDRAAVRTTPWKVSPEACVRAFQANPTDTTLALAIAQRALALDRSAAEAYVIVSTARVGVGFRPAIGPFVTVTCGRYTQPPRFGLFPEWRNMVWPLSTLPL